MIIIIIIIISITIIRWPGHPVHKRLLLHPLRHHLLHSPLLRRSGYDIYIYIYIYIFDPEELF